MYINVNGIRMYYKKIGRGNPLIMVHGNDENGKIFDKSIEILKDFFTVYVIDLRDHGKSQRVKTLSYTDHMNDIYDFIKKLEIKKPVFYGFSDGGIIGLMLAIKYQDLLSKLIVSGVNINPKGILISARIGMMINYVVTKSKKIKMMLVSPNIKYTDLKRIKVKTYLTVGENDLIYYKHTMMIKNSIENSNIKVFKGYNHSSYIVNSDIIAKYICKNINT